MRKGPEEDDISRPGRRWINKNQFNQSSLLKHITPTIFSFPPPMADHYYYYYYYYHYYYNHYHHYSPLTDVSMLPKVSLSLDAPGPPAGLAVMVAGAVVVVVVVVVVVGVVRISSLSDSNPDISISDPPSHRCESRLKNMGCLMLAVTINNHKSHIWKEGVWFYPVSN